MWGQYFTLKEVSDFMVNLITKKRDALILEPCAGEGVFIESLLEKGFSNIKAYEVDPELIKKVNGISIQLRDFLKAKKDEIRKEGISLAQTTIVIEAIPAAAIFGFTWYWAYPLIAVPSWFIASNMGESNAKKIVEQKKRVFFEKDQ